MAETKIEWTERTWNPVVGCTIHSPGCKNCYAMRMAARLEAMAVKPSGEGNVALLHYEGTTQSSRRGAVWTGKIGIAPDDAFTAPLRRKKPTDYFVNSMSDLFHKDVPDHEIDRVFAVMALCPQHTFKVLTKRSDRMREYMSTPGLAERLGAACLAIYNGSNLRAKTLFSALGERATAEQPEYVPLPLPNVWLGVSIEDCDALLERATDLGQTPAAVRFWSAEPLLEDLRQINPVWLPDWVIVGGESGPGARPMHPDWARSLRDQCSAAGVAFHFKQWGEWAPSENCALDCTAEALIYDATAKEWRKSIDGGWIGDQAMCRVGKKRAGRLLDGVEHNGFPGAGQ